jgi:hypothetical protein
LNLIIAEAQLTANILAGGKVSDQHRLTVYKTVAHRTFFWRRNANHGIVAGACYLHARRNDQGNV